KNESSKIERYTENVNYYGTRPQVNEVNIIDQDEKQDRDNKSDDEQTTNQHNEEYELEQQYRHNDIKDTINYLRNNMRYPCYLPKTKTIYEWLDEIDCYMEAYNFSNTDKFNTIIQCIDGQVRELVFQQIRYLNGKYQELVIFLIQEYGISGFTQERIRKFQRFKKYPKETIRQFWRRFDNELY